MNPNEVFENVKKVRKIFAPKTLFDHMEKWLNLSEQDLKKNNSKFFAVITTYVVENFKNRRKGGVPVGHLDKFCLKSKINLVDTLVAMIVSVLRKRGVRELVEANKNNKAVVILNTAFTKTTKIK